ncbi:hypothetical protein SC1_01562 [Sphingopyxis sp. C-1]|nr:hypothetical protein SC1_01562 [Sphingopyxis sp. C-1]
MNQRAGEGSQRLAQQNAPDRSFTVNNFIYMKKQFLMLKFEI